MCVSVCVCGVCVCVCVRPRACVCSLGHPACNAHAPYGHRWPAPLYNIFSQYLINGTIFEKRLLNKKGVF